MSSPPPDSEPAKSKTPAKHSLVTLVWHWGVIGFFEALLVGGWFSFMTSNHRYIADAFFLASTVLFICKFISWEEARAHAPWVVPLGCIASIAVCLGALALSRYLNRPGRPAAAQITKQDVIDGADVGATRALKDHTESRPIPYGYIALKNLEEDGSGGFIVGGFLMIREYPTREKGRGAPLSLFSLEHLEVELITPVEVNIGNEGWWSCNATAMKAEQWNNSDGARQRIFELKFKGGGVTQFTISTKNGVSSIVIALTTTAQGLRYEQWVQGAFLLEAGERRHFVVHGISTATTDSFEDAERPLHVDEAFLSGHGVPRALPSFVPSKAQCPNGAEFSHIGQNGITIATGFPPDMLR